MCVQSIHAKHTTVAAAPLLGSAVCTLNVLSLRGSQCERKHGIRKNAPSHFIDDTTDQMSWL